MDVKETIKKRAEEYGQAVRKRLVEKMPPHFATGEIPKWDGSSDLATKAAYEAGAASLLPALDSVTQERDEIAARCIRLEHRCAELRALLAEKKP